MRRNKTALILLHCVVQIAMQYTWWLIIHEEVADKIGVVDLKYHSKVHHAFVTVLASEVEACHQCPESFTRH
jgi:hypothetical protein